VRVYIYMTINMPECMLSEPMKLYLNFSLIYIFLLMFLMAKCVFFFFFSVLVMAMNCKEIVKK